MTDAELLKLAETDPAAVETTISALKRAIDFRNGRGAMLRRLGFDPHAAAFIRNFEKENF